MKSGTWSHRFLTNNTGMWCSCAFNAMSRSIDCNLFTISDVFVLPQLGIGCITFLLWQWSESQKPLDNCPQSMWLNYAAWCLLLACPIKSFFWDQDVCSLEARWFSFQLRWWLLRIDLCLGNLGYRWPRSSKCICGWWVCLCLFFFFAVFYWPFLFPPHRPLQCCKSYHSLVQWLFEPSAWFLQTLRLICWVLR